MSLVVVVTLFSFLSIVLLILSKIYFKVTIGRCTSDNLMTDKVVVITGGTSGIGLETVRDLVRRGAIVIVPCRDVDRGLRVKEDIVRSLSGQCRDQSDVDTSSRIIVEKCDLSSLSSIESFVTSIDHFDRIDVLILNAGMVPPPNRRILTDDEIEVQFASNHFGHFLLTNLLMPKLILTHTAHVTESLARDSRIIVVTSMLYQLGRIDFSNVNFEKSIRDPFFRYCETKLCNVLFTMELAKRLNGRGIRGVTVNCLHPGLVKTSINRSTPFWLKNVIQPIFYSMWAKSPIEGAQTTIHLSVTDEVKGITGKYWSDCRVVDVSPVAKDEELSSKLWTISEQSTRRSFVI